MTKYTKQAILELVKMIAIAGVSAGVLGFSAAYFGIGTVILGLAIALFLFSSYKYVKIQAEINERLDQLNNK